MKTRSEARPGNSPPQATRKLSRKGQRERATAVKSGKGTLPIESGSLTTVSPKLDNPLKTPKPEKKRPVESHTPAQDDFLLSQHFDSQTEVGWDCNSPENFRRLKKLSHRNASGSVAELVTGLITHESDDASVESGRGTPHLLSLWWEDKPEPEPQPSSCNKNHERPPRKGRVRRKSARDTVVSRKLLKKLTSALENSEPVETDGHLLDEDALPVLLEDEPGERLTTHNESGDLFTSTKQTTNKTDGFRVDQQQFHNGQKSSPANSDISWSDDELFDDSFIIKATQLAEDVKGVSSPVLGSKRKPSGDVCAPSSKCFRFTAQAAGLSKHQPQKSSVVTTSTKCKVSITSAVSASSAAGIGASAGLRSLSSNRNTLGSSKSHSETSSFPQRNNTTVGRNTQSAFRSCNQSGPKMVTSSSSTLSRTCSSASSRLAVTTCAPITVSAGSAGVQGVGASVTNYSKQRPRESTLSKQSSFRKHSSFSGPDYRSTGNVPSNSRQRSLSGNTNLSQTRTVIPFTSTSKPCSLPVSHSFTNNASVLNTQSSTARVVSHEGSVKQGFVGGARIKQENKSSIQTAGVTTVGRNLSNKTSGSLPVNKGLSPIAEKRLSTSGFDTSLSEDILCQLAEPDELLDSQICQETTIVKQEFPKATSNIVQGKPKDRIVPTVNHTVETASSKQNKCFKFKPSQKHADSGLGLLKGNKTCDSSRTSTCDKVLPLNKQTNPSVGVKLEKCGPPVSHVVPAKVKPVMTSLASTDLSRCPTNVHKTEDTFPAYSEDLFLSDDEELAEPQLLALLDEVEFRATQQATCKEETSSQGSNRGQFCYGKSSSQGYSPNKRHSVSPGRQSSQGSPGKQGSPNKYSQAEIELKKQEAIRRHSRTHSLHGSQGQPSSQGSPGKQGSPNKYSQVEIELKKQEAIRRQSESHGLHCSQGHQSSQGSPGKQGSPSKQGSPNKYSQAEIELKKQEAIRRQAESHGLHGSQGQQSSQGQQGSQGHCSQGQQGSPNKYSPQEIELKKQEALRRRKLKFSQQVKQGER